MDTSEVEKFFAFWPEEARKRDTLVVRAQSTRGPRRHVDSFQLQRIQFHLHFLRTWRGWIWTCWLLTSPWMTTSS